MKILFIYSYEYLEPIGIMALSAFLKQNGHSCDFIDIALEKHYRKSIRDFKPDIIAYSITTGKHSFYQRFNAELKEEFQFFSIFGGPHATFFPKFIEEPGVDAVCVGEGEYPLLDLANALESGSDPTSIASLLVKRDGKIYRNNTRDLIGDLSSLPFLDRELVNKYKAYAKLHRRVMLTARGCPYKCSYCFNHSFNDLFKGKGRIIRRRSIDHVINELKEVRESCRPRRFHFLDDTFILDAKWCLEFCRRYEQEIGLPFIAYVRLNLVTDEIIRSLKQAGCITILYAIESGNEHIRNEILDRNMSERQILDGAKIINNHQMRTYVQSMIGLPDETLEMAFETIRLNIRCQPDWPWCSLFQPYPGTKLWRYCKEKGYLSGEEFHESYYKNSVLNMPDKMQFENLRHLFSIAVAFPFLIPAIRLLIRLPLGSLYYFIWNVHRVWCYVLKVKWVDLSELIP